MERWDGSASGWFLSGDGWRGGGVFTGFLLRALGVALDAAGAFPGVEFLGLELVDVGHDGTEDVDLGVDEGELLVDEFGVFDAFLNFGAVVGVDFVEGVAVLAEVGDEVGSDGEGDETGAEGGLDGFLSGSVAAAGDGGVIVFETTPPMEKAGRREREGTLKRCGSGYEASPEQERTRETMCG